MGFSIYYHSTRPVSPEEADVIREAATGANQGRTWLSCEPVYFSRNEPGDDGRLVGASKPNFSPHPDDVAASAREGLPDGDLRDLFQILCNLSRDHGIDWEISHDHEPGPVGYIRGGTLDPELAGTVEAFAELADIIGEYENDAPGVEDEA
jgi:hypothetical protein